MSKRLADELGRAQEVKETTLTRKRAKPSQSPMSRVLRMVSEAQTLLADLGYDPGPADGIAGPMCRAAVERYQTDNGLTVDGDVTPALLDSLREAKAAAETQPAEPEENREEAAREEIQSVRSKIRDNVKQSFGLEPEANEVGLAPNDTRQSTSLETEEEAQSAPIDLVIGAGIPPTDADVVFASLDDEGKPGKLTQKILNKLGLPLDVLPSPEDLMQGFSSRWDERVRRGIIFIVTRSSRAGGEGLIQEHLSRALRTLDPDRWFKSKTLWLPIFSAGIEGLSLHECLIAIIEVISDPNFWQFNPLKRIVLLGPLPDSGGTALEELAQLAGGLLASKNVSKYFSLRTAVGPGWGADTDSEMRTVVDEAATAIPIVTRPYFHSDLAAKDDALNVRDQAAIFAKLIAAREVALPLSIGLFGNWGSGKTYFMELIEEQVRALATGEDSNDAESTYMRRVAQIRFNAWHYVDTNLWASLAIRIFDGLAAQFLRRAGDSIADLRARLRAEMESSTDAKREAEQKQQEAQKEREKAAIALEKLRAERREQNKAYDAMRFARLLASNALHRDNFERIKKIAADVGLSNEIQTVEDAAKLAEQMRALNGQARGVMQAISQQFADWQSAGIAIAVIAAFIAAFIVISMAFPDTSVYVGEVIAAVSAAVAWAGNRLARISKGVDLLDSLRAGFAALKADAGETEAERQLREKVEAYDARIRTAESQIVEADRRIAEAEAELQRINAGGLVYDFLEARGNDPTYKKELGLISTIRSDFHGLKKLLEDWNENYEADSGLAPIERIVLYIDDLDRCHPDKVVEVLQAVHLLLAFDLFVVIVAVDPRWLERSLYRAYVPELTERSLNGMEAQHLREFSPQNYLEKIFQIPFSLAAMSSDGYAKLINDLIVTRGEFESRRVAAPAVGATEGGEGGREAPLADGGTDHTANAPRPTVTDAPLDGEAGDGVGHAGEKPPAVGEPARPPEEAASRKRSSEEEILFNDWEQAFIQQLYPFVPTPRLAKRMINIYRLIRVHALESGDGDAFFTAEGDHRAVLVLLALNIGYPRVAGPLLRLLKTERRIKSFRTLLAYADQTEKAITKRSEGDLSHSVAKLLKYDEATANELVRVRAKMDRVDEALGEWSRANPGTVTLTKPDDIETYSRWAPEVGRYSFHWNLE